MAKQKVYKPLKEDHPLVSKKECCPICKKTFRHTERTMLLSVSLGEGTFLPSTIQVVVVHATCGLKGAKTELGEIERIKDGDASPYPVLLVGSKQATFEEMGIEVD